MILAVLPTERTWNHSKDEQEGPSVHFSIKSVYLWSVVCIYPNIVMNMTYHKYHKLTFKIHFKVFLSLDCMFKVETLHDKVKRLNTLKARNWTQIKVFGSQWAFLWESLYLLQDLKYIKISNYIIPYDVQCT